MTRINVEIRSYFATPVAVVTLPDAAALNPELERVILERARRDQGVQHSNLGGWQSSWDFEDWGGAPAKRLLDAARDVASRGSPRTVPASRCGSRGRPMPGPTSTARAMATSSTPIRAPIGPAPTMSTTAASRPTTSSAAPSRCRTRAASRRRCTRRCSALRCPGGQSAGASELIFPESGQFILFPSWLQHGVRPYLGDRMRISVAFNFSI